MGIKIEYLGNREWKLLEDLEYSGGTIESGFIFDGASAPRIFWSVIPPIQETGRAACIHDYMCRHASNSKERKEADEEFYRELRKTDLNIVRCILGYIGVRIGSWWGTGVRYKHWRVNR